MCASVGCHNRIPDTATSDQGLVDPGERGREGGREGRREGGRERGRGGGREGGREQGEQCEVLYSPEEEMKEEKGEGELWRTEG